MHLLHHKEQRGLRHLFLPQIINDYSVIKARDPITATPMLKHQGRRVSGQKQRLNPMKVKWVHGYL